MMKIKSKKDEFNLFNQLSSDWWNDEGHFSVLHRIRPIRIKYIIDQIKPRNLKGLKILDIGCGGGLVSESLAKLGGNVTGVDFVENNINIAKNHSLSNNLEIEYKCIDAENENIKNKYDIIILFEILEHLENWKTFVSKIKQNLNKDGIIILSTINRNIYSKIFAIHIAENILNWIPKGTHDFKKLIKPNEILEVFEKEGLKVTNFKGLIFNPIIDEWQISQNTKINYFCTAKI